MPIRKSHAVLRTGYLPTAPARRRIQPMENTRRTMIAGTAAGLGLLPFLVGGCSAWMTPEEAKQRKLPLRTLAEAEAATLERFGDILLPGASAAGLAHFVDHHLSVPAEESLLLLRYLDVAPPFAGFYQAGLAALDGHANALHGRPFVALSDAAASAIVGAIIESQPAGWQGPPAPFFSFVARSDAVDVVYGTRAGLAKLGIPVMAHIEPEREW